MATDAILRAAQQTAQVVPRVDPTGLGLVHLGVDQALAAAGLTQTSPVLSGLSSTAATLTGGISVLSDVAGQTGLLGTIPELRGVRLDAAWNAGPRRRPLPQDRDTVLQPGALLPLETTSGLGIASPPLRGLSALFLPLPQVSPVPATWQAEIALTLSAAALPGLIDDGTDGGPLALEGVEPLTSPPPVTLPLTITLPSLVIPPVLVLCTGRHLQPPAMVICPTPLLATGDALLGDLTAAVRHIDLLRRLLTPARIRVPLLEALGDALAALSPLLSSALALLHGAPQESNLNLFELQLRLLNDLEPEDEIRSLAYVGLPGPAVTLFRQRDFTGASLELRVTPGMAERGEVLIVIDDLKDVPATEGVTPTGALRYLTSSYRFRGLQPPNGAALPPNRFTDLLSALRDRNLEDILGHWRGLRRPSLPSDPATPATPVGGRQ